MIDHHKTSSYHLEANGAVESFNKTLTKGLTEICNVEKDDWDDKIPAILWAYKTAYKKSTNQMPFKMAYGQEFFVPLHLKQHATEITHLLKVDIGSIRDEKIFEL